MIERILNFYWEEKLEYILNVLLDWEISGDEEMNSITWFNSIVNFRPDIYIEYFCDYESDPYDSYQCYDTLWRYLNELKETWVIWKYWHRKTESSEEILKKYYWDDEGNLPENTPFQEAKICEKFGWEYNIYIDKDKVRLFRDIIFKKQKYICKIWTIKSILKFSDKIDIESLIDWMWLEEKYIFNNSEILLLSIFTSNKLNIAKLFHFMVKIMVVREYRDFQSLLSLEDAVVMDNSKYNYNWNYEGFYFTSEDLEKKQTELSNKNYTYNFIDSHLTLWNIHVSFKESFKQKKLFEFLLNNQDRHVSSEELSRLKIWNMKSLLQDIKNKIELNWATKLQVRKMFYYFENGDIQYCRILL